MELLEFLWKLLEELYWAIITGIILMILGAVFFFGRHKIRKWLFRRKVTPKTTEALSVYEKEILPEFVESKLKIIVAKRKEELPAELPFGYIFVPEGEEELIWRTLIAYIPVSASLRRIKILFDESLRKSIFDFLSYQLGLKLGKEEIALSFRDNALRERSEDFQAVEKLYSDGKLTYVILAEASIRMQGTMQQPSVSDIEEFSTLVRKIAEIDATILRIGKWSSSYYVEKALEKKRGVILLARGFYLKTAVEVAEGLRQRGFKNFTQDEIGFQNPEIGIWFFADGAKVPFMRIWLKKENAD